MWVVLEFCEFGSLERILRVCNGISSQTEFSALLEAMPEITASNENATAAVQKQLCTLFGGQHVKDVVKIPKINRSRMKRDQDLNPEPRESTCHIL